MRRLTAKRHPMAGAFIFLLLGVFAVLSTLLVMLAARVYGANEALAEEKASRRVLVSYPLNKLRAADQKSVYVTREGDTAVLVLPEQYDGDTYETCIYCYDGMLRELFYCPDEGDAFDPESGDVLMQADSFEPALRDGLLVFEVTARGESYRAAYRLRG